MTLVNVRRFLTYTLNSQLDWVNHREVGDGNSMSNAHTLFQVKFQRTIAISREPQQKMTRYARALKAAHEGRDVTADLQRRNDRSVTDLTLRVKT